MNHPPTPSANERALPFAAAAYSASSDEHAQPLDVLRGEVRVELRALRNSVARLASTREVSAQLEELHKALAELKPPPPKMRAVTQLLERTGIEGRAATLVRRAVAKAMQNAKDGYTLEDAWRAALSEMIAITAWPLAQADSSLVALVGPSGVGKTTTSAKIAARFIAASRTVTLVACDHFRVGAAHQLGRYAQLMGAEFAKATTESELDNIISEATTDVVILDTAGTVPPDAAIARVAARTTRRASILLCMPACIRASDAEDLSHAFASARPTSLCVTKLDETFTPAGLVHGRVGSSLSISTLCNGPRVPEDIAPATNAAIVDALVNATRSTS